MADLPDLKFDDHKPTDDLPDLEFDDSPAAPQAATTKPTVAQDSGPFFSFGLVPDPRGPQRLSTPTEEASAVGSMLKNLLTKGELPQRVEDGLANFREGAPGAGAAQKAGAALRATLPDGGLEYGARYDKQLADIKGERAARHKRDPEAADRGEALGAMAAPNVGMVGNGALPALSRIVGNAAMGAADKATRADSFAEAGDEAKKAALTAGGTQALFESMGGLGRFLKGFGERRAVKSIEPSLAQQQGLAKKGAEEKLGRALLDEDVTKFGSSVDSMAPRIEELLASKGQRIGDIRAEADAAGAAVDMDRLARMGEARAAFSDATNETAKSAAKAYARNADSFAKVPKRSLAETQEEVMSLNSQIPFAKDLADMTPAQQAYKQLRSDMTAQMDDQVRQYAPTSAGEYADAKEMFGLFKDADKILDKSTARHARNADIGLRDMLAAQAAAKQGVAGGAKSAAVAAASKLARERGNSALAVTADRVSQLLGQNPARFGRYAKPLLDAAKRGNLSLMITHVLLMDDPEYAALVGEDAK